MRVVYKKSFVKAQNKYPQKIKNQINERLKLFQDNPESQILNKHNLSGNYSGFLSINISGDLRAIFIYHADEDLAEFYLLGSHSELYK